MNNSYLLAGIKAGKLLSMIFRNKGFSLRYTGRVLFLLNAGVWSTVFSIVETIKYKKKLQNFKSELNPIFIIGNWRTGTTFLHQLMALDAQFTTPTIYKVSNPDHFLVSKKYYHNLLAKVLGNTRPMDNVKIGPDEAQEDEYALLKLCKNTPLEKMIFSDSKTFFLDKCENFMPPNQNEFIGSLFYLEKKLAFETGKRIVFKNPFHSLRLELIIKMFPRAQYIHIYRNPADVIPSSINMWNIVGKQNLLKGKWIEPSGLSIIKLYRKILLTVRKHFEKIDENNKIEIKFEELENNPVEQIKTIYEKLNIKFTEDYKSKLETFCSEIKTYKKNKYDIKTEEINTIKEFFLEILPEYYTQTNENKL